jgi:hypothetical protein
MVSWTAPIFASRRASRSTLSNAGRGVACPVQLTTYPRVRSYEQLTPQHLAPACPTSAKSVS